GKTIFGKPRDMRDAERMITAMVGRTHEVVTAVCLCRGRVMRRFTVSTRVRFKRLNAVQIRNYLRLIHPLDKAGAYAAQEHWDKIIAAVDGSFTNVVGLPM